ncbi:uncharacterized protein VP01_3233g3 [Puccinia sorghi]|uniref:Glutamate synthase domain-containing protein n=1 Tax=Puccinia sorghi TaxID=27349 RepID=A0A0L6UY53_9BASI|nr:uncharacterized protein VP01_3233g3 [Puccinia sorghi]
MAAWLEHAAFQLHAVEQVFFPVPVLKAIVKTIPYPHNQLAYNVYCQNMKNRAFEVTLHSLLDFDYQDAPSIPLDPLHKLVKDSFTSAMSYGSISQESHSALELVERLNKTKGFMNYKWLNKNYQNPKIWTK